MQLRKIRALIAEARRHATMENAGFKDICASGVPMFNGEPLTEKHVTEFIKERTRLHRESWILPDLDEVLAEIDAEISRTSRKPSKVA